MANQRKAVGILDKAKKYADQPREDSLHFRENQRVCKLSKGQWWHDIGPHLFSSESLLEGTLSECWLEETAIPFVLNNLVTF